MERLVRELEKSGFAADANIVAEIAKLGDRAFSSLAELATGGSEEGSTCAVHFLAMLGHYKAQLAINSHLIWKYADSDDEWITEEMPGVLARMGPGAVQTLSGLMHHAGADMWVRIGASRALAGIATDHPQERQYVVESIKEAVRKEKDATIRTWIADSLVGMADPDLYEYLENLLSSGAITDEVSDIDVLESIYKGEMDPSATAPRDPLSLFEYCRRWKDPARNDPCPCGSGKKYKRCCMGKR